MSVNVQYMFACMYVLQFCIYMYVCMYVCIPLQERLLPQAEPYHDGYANTTKASYQHQHQHQDSLF